MSPRRLAAVVLFAVLLSGCSLAGRTFGTYVDDKAITGSVKVRLIKNINVDTFEGTVYLSGDVDTPQQKSDAEVAAWRVEGVEQVVNDLRVRFAPAVSASPRMTAPSPLQERVPGIARLDPALPGAPALAYDRAGAIVATVYARPLRDVVERGIQDLGPTARPITHVVLYSVPASAGQPEALMNIVLWHVSPTAAAALE